MNEGQNERRMPLERTYTVPEVAERYHVTVHTVRNWVRTRVITAINVSRSGKGPYVFREKDLAEFEERCLTRKPEEGQDG